MAGGASGLTTRGRCLLAAAAAIAVCAVALDERDLLRVAVFVAALPLLALAVTASARVSLQARRVLSPQRVAVGTPARATVEVSSRGRVPGAELRLADTMPPALGGTPRFVLPRLARRGATTLRYPLTPVLRGAHQVGPLLAQVSDPFGLTRFDHELAGRSQLLVVPVTVPLRGLPAGTGRGDGTRGAARLSAGRGEDDAVVRPYRDGDDLRKVHWRSTARRDELMVRVEERPWLGGVTVLLDRRAVAHRGSGPSSSLEWTVSLAASACLHLLAHGRQVRLVTDDGVELATGQGPDAVLAALATVAVSPGREVLARGAAEHAGELLALLGGTGSAGLARLLAARPAGARSHAVVVDAAAWADDREDATPDTEQTARMLAAAGWGVAVGWPGRPPAVVWDELCAGAGLQGAAR